MSEWIDVKDRLPVNDYGKHWKDRQYYLVLLKPSGLMRVAKFGYKEYNWWIDSHDSVLDSKFYTEVTRIFKELDELVVEMEDEISDVVKGSKLTGLEKVEHNSLCETETYGKRS